MRRLVVLSLVGAIAAFLVVAWLAPRPADAGELAGRMVGAAEHGRDVGPLLPPRGWATVSTPSGVVRHYRDHSEDAPPGSAEAPLPGPVALVAGASDERSGYSVVVAVPATGSPWRAGLAAAGVVLLTALAAQALARLPRRPAEPRTGSPTEPRTGPPAAPAPASDEVRMRRLAEQRSKLVHDLAELLPQMPEALAWQATDTLESVGVRVVRPDGSRFDPALHHAVGTDRAPDRQAVGVVARTVRPGYTDGDRLVVHPKVVVFEEAP